MPKVSSSEISTNGLLQLKRILFGIASRADVLRGSSRVPDEPLRTSTWEVVWEVIGSNPVGDTDFFLSHTRDMLIILLSHLFHWAQNLPSFIVSAHSATSTLLILAVCRTRDKYEPSIWPRSPWVFRLFSSKVNYSDGLLSLKLRFYVDQKCRIQRG